MKPKQKVTWTVLWGLAVMGMIGLVGTGVLAHRQMSGDEPSLDVLFDAPKFSLSDQNGKTVTDATLHGNVWVAMVFFSQCPGACPMMTAHMAELQHAVPLPDVKIVAITLDPEHDTPEVLKEYGGKFDCDQSRWYFLRGDKKTTFDLAVNGFKLPAAPAGDGQPISHTLKVLLIDRANKVRGIYDSRDEKSMKKLADDARMLAQG